MRFNAQAHGQNSDFNKKTNVRIKKKNMKKNKLKTRLYYARREYEYVLIIVARLCEWEWSWFQRQHFHIIIRFILACLSLYTLFGVFVVDICKKDNWKWQLHVGNTLKIRTMHVRSWKIREKKKNTEFNNRNKWSHVNCILNFIRFLISFANVCRRFGWQISSVFVYIYTRIMSTKFSKFFFAVANNIHFAKIYRHFAHTECAFDSIICSNIFTWFRFINSVMRAPNETTYMWMYFAFRIRYIIASHLIFVFFSLGELLV